MKTIKLSNNNSSAVAMQKHNQVLVLRTNVKTKKKVKSLKPLLNNHPYINSWSFDIEDIDNVLRIEAQKKLNQDDVIYLLKACGYCAEMLED